MNEIFSEVFTAKFVIINVIIATLLSIIANLLTARFVTGSKACLRFLRSSAGTLLVCALFFGGMLLGGGTAVAMNEGWIAESATSVNIANFGFTSTGIGIFLLPLTNERLVDELRKAKPFDRFVYFVIGIGVVSVGGMFVSAFFLRGAN